MTYPANSQGANSPPAHEDAPVPSRTLGAIPHSQAPMGHPARDSHQHHQTFGQPSLAPSSRLAHETIALSRQPNLTCSSDSTESDSLGPTPHARSRPLPEPPLTLQLSPTLSAVDQQSEDSSSAGGRPAEWPDEKASVLAVPLSPADSTFANVSGPTRTDPSRSSNLTQNTTLSPLSAHNSNLSPSSPLVADYKHAFLNNAGPVSPSVIETGVAPKHSGLVDAVQQEAFDPLTDVLNQLDEAHLEPPPAYSETVPVIAQVTTSNDTVTAAISRPTPLPSVRFDGNPRHTITHCPESSNRRYRLTWFRLRNVPCAEAFLMCSKCHADFIAGTQLVQHFEAVVREQGCCRFALPKLALELLPEAKRAGDIFSVKRWVERRASRRFCDTLSCDDPDVVWYTPKELAVPCFFVCGECMDDVVGVTPYSDKFAVASMASNNTTACILRDDHKREALLRASKAGDKGWERYCATLAQARSLAPCHGDAVPAASRKWYTTVRTIPRFVVCETCYLNQIKLSLFDDQFALFTERPGADDRWNCDFIAPREQFAWVLANEHADFDLWWLATETVVVRSLALAGRPDLEMYGLANHPQFSAWGDACDSDFSLCGLCYACFVTPLSLQKFFRPRTIGTGHHCSFCTSPLRFATYLDHFIETLDTELWAPFYECAFWLGRAARCSGSVLVDHGRWWGWRPILQICEECWWTFAQDTWVASQVELHGETLPRSMCSLHSYHMRDIWTHACRAKSTTSLLQFAAERHRVYAANYRHSYVHEERSTWSQGTQPAALVGAVDYQISAPPVNPAQFVTEACPAPWNTLIDNQSPLPSRTQDFGANSHRVSELESDWSH